MSSAESSSVSGSILSVGSVATVASVADYTFPVAGCVKPMELRDGLGLYDRRRPGLIPAAFLSCPFDPRSDTSSPFAGFSEGAGDAGLKSPSKGC